MKEVSVEEITELVKVSLKESLTKHNVSHLTPEGKEILKRKLHEVLEDLQVKGVITIVE